LIVADALFLCACGSPARSIRPVIYTRDEDKYRAMTSAQVIVLAEIEDTKLLGDTQTLEMHQNFTGPMTFMIPLSLARIPAKALLTLRGDDHRRIQFYSWIWNAGSHSGSRLFHTTPGSNHILFLRYEGGYLHTVGDYPSYDLEMPSRWISNFIADWNASPRAQDIFERLAAIRLRTQLDQKSEILRNYTSEDMWDLMGLTSPFFIASQLDDNCRQLANRFGRFAACEAEGREFPGRCEAFRRAQEADSEGIEASNIAGSLSRCEQNAPYKIEWLRSKNWPLPTSDGDRDPTPDRHRLAMRLYASATDSALHKAACEAAATMPEARDIPECDAGPREAPRSSRQPE
jgi:hypothetical protein